MTEPWAEITETTSKPKITTTGKLLLATTGGIAAGLTLLCAPFLSPALRKFCLPYVPATRTQVANIFQALENRGGSLLDIGSGDGRVVIEAARRHFKADGVELNLWLVLYSRVDALLKGVGSRVKFYRRNLWGFPMGAYDNVVIFGVEQMMSELEQKFCNECKMGAVVVACRFPLPHKEPVRIYGSGIDTVWVYNFSNT